MFFVVSYFFCNNIGLCVKIGWSVGGRVVEIIVNNFFIVKVFYVVMKRGK